MTEDNDEDLEIDNPPKISKDDSQEKVQVTKKVLNAQLETTIITKVFEKLGKPKDLLRCSINNVYGNRYRVNIIRKSIEKMLCFEAGKTTDSFFIHLSQEGDIIYSNPEITRRY